MAIPKIKTQDIIKQEERKVLDKADMEMKRGEFVFEDEVWK